MTKKSKDFYLNILGVARNSTEDEIKDAYRELIKIWHPDRASANNKDHSEANEKTKLINEAYAELKNYMPLDAKKTSRDNPFTSNNGKENKKNNIKRTPVKSSNIRSVGYDIDKRILQIEFKKGSIYEYYEVPERIFSELMNASSKGNYANQHVFSRYRYSNVSER